MKDTIGIFDFLKNNPGISITSIEETEITLTGKYELCSCMTGYGNVDENYELEIKIPNSFPKGIPIVREISNKIPRDYNHHINFTDDSLCLGSDIRIQTEIYNNPTLDGFMNKCIVPFLTAATIKIKTENTEVFRGLAHGDRGLLDDYKDIFSVNTDEQVIQILKALGLRKRIANKLLCPCGCGKKLGNCKLHFVINKVRKINYRSWFKQLDKKLKLRPPSKIPKRQINKMINKLFKTQQ